MHFSMKFLLLFILLAISLYSFKGQKLERLVNLKGSSLGTFYNVVIANQMTLRQKELIHQDIKDKLQELDEQMSTYKSYSLLSKFNEHKSFEPFSVTDEIITVVKLAKQLYYLSDKQFNIALDPIIDLWGFDKTARKAIPNDLLLKDTLKQCNLDNLVIGNNFLQKKDVNLRLNLSSIAKGFIVDEIAKLLLNKGLSNFLVEIGGEIFAHGYNYHQAWQVGIEDPNNLGNITKNIAIHNEAVASSGTYLNYFTDNGKKYSHIINAKTGYPININDIALVSIKASSCMLADALSTACMLLSQAKCSNILTYFHASEILRKLK